MKNIINTKMIKLSIVVLTAVFFIGFLSPFTLISDEGALTATSLSAEAYGGGGGDGGCCGGGGNPKPVPKPTPTPTPTPDHDPDPTPIIPVCTISATPNAITAGGNSTLTWTTTRATSASINQGIGAVAIGSGVTRVVSPNGTITYTMTVTSSTGRTATCATAVTVTPVSVPAPSCVLSANPTSITLGGSSQLSWTSQNAVSASINQGIGAVALNGNRSVSPTAAASYTLTVVNSVGVKATCATAVTVTPVSVPAPSCVLSANPTSITLGGSSQLSWTSQNAVSASINQGIGAVALNGNRSVSPTAAASYTLTVVNSVGVKATCAKTISVVTPTPAPTCDSFTANPTSIVRGSSAILTWATTDATVASIAKDSVAPISVAVDGTMSVSPTATAVFTLTATGNGKTVSCPVTVTVTNIPTPNAPTCDSFTANPVTINRGQSSTLTWATTNASSASINNAVGAVAVDGSVNVSPLQSTTYTLTAVGNGSTVSCPVTVNVNQPNTAISCAANVNFSASPSSITRGDSSTLTWSTTGLTNVRFDNLNPTTLNGSVTVSPTDSITYTLIGTNGSETINCPVTVSVSTSGGGGGGSSNPTCKLTISDKNISLGERVTLKWDTSRATEVTLTDNHGKTLIDTDGKSTSAKKDLYDGEITIRPDRDTTYTLLAEKGSRDKTCKVSVDVEDTIVVTQIRDQQPLVTGIALTQVPYTGFEAGPFMTSVFYTLLAAWALYMAYVLVGRRNGANMSAFTPATVTADVTPAEVMFPTAVTTAPVFYQAPEPVVAQVATVGYEAHTDITTAIEAQAHAAHVLLSSDAISYFIAATAGEDRTAIMTGVLAAAKASYPSEDGWVVVSADRMVELASKF